LFFVVVGTTSTTIRNELGRRPTACTHYPTACLNPIRCQPILVGGDHAQETTTPVDEGVHHQVSIGRHPHLDDGLIIAGESDVAWVALDTAVSAVSVFVIRGPSNGHVDVPYAETAYTIIVTASTGVAAEVLVNELNPVKVPVVSVEEVRVQLDTVRTRTGLTIGLPLILVEVHHEYTVRQKRPATTPSASIAVDA
jgi:hypothetical protein